MGSGAACTLLYAVNEQWTKLVIRDKTNCTWDAPVRSLDIIRCLSCPNRFHRWGNMPAVDIVNLDKNENRVQNLALAFIGELRSTRDYQQNLFELGMFD